MSLATKLKGGLLMPKQDNLKLSIDQLIEELDNTSTKETLGVVTDCQFLNIRTSPDIDSQIVCREPALSELIVDLNKSTADWYNVCTVAGVSGFCMKKFVIIKS